MKLNELLQKGGEKTKLIVVSLCAVVAVGVAAVVFFTGDGVDSLSDSADASGREGPVGTSDKDYQHLVTIGKIARAKRPDDYVPEEGARDPMMAPSGVLASKRPATSAGDSKPAAPKTLPPMWLSGIIWDPENPIAMIDGLDLRVGDSIKGARVVEIRMESVVLSYASRTHVLTVE